MEYKNFISFLPWVIVPLLVWMVSYGTIEIAKCAHHYVNVKVILDVLLFPEGSGIHDS